LPGRHGHGEEPQQHHDLLPVGTGNEHGLDLLPAVLEQISGPIQGMAGLNNLGEQNMHPLIRKDETAVSPVIATILMVAITVVLAAVLYVMVSGLITPVGGNTPLVTFSSVT